MLQESAWGLCLAPEPAPPQWASIDGNHPILLQLLSPSFCWASGFCPRDRGPRPPPGLPAHSARLQVMARALPFLYVLGHCKAPTVPLSPWD